MKSIPKLIRRYVGILLLSCGLLLALNLILLSVMASRQIPNAHPWKTAEEAAGSLRQTDEGLYALSEEMALELQESDAWAVFIDNETKQVRWHTDNLPETIPMSYTLSDIAGLTRGYVDGYPTFTGKREDGLVVLGYPKDRFWKHMWPSWDYAFIAGLPRTFFIFLAVNTALIFLIYIVANAKLLKSVRPIVNGIQSLPLGAPVHVKERGLLSELAQSINTTSELLQSQKNRLRKKETARANWIAGVSHDIRTPLSMVMGYAGQLAENIRLPEEERRKAVVILKQSRRMQNLINDINLASKMEYNMQPVNLREENIVAIVRQTVVDYMNMDIDSRHPIIWEAGEAFTACVVNADRNLMRRAVSNLIQNCIDHNEDGCTIYVGVGSENGKCVIAVEDDGVGVSKEQLEKLKNTVHYMVCDENTEEQRHGLGLLLVKQITAAHGGTVMMGHSPKGGFSVRLVLPLKSVYNVDRRIARDKEIM
ncbi:MAG: HAMP domain-containing histidine kinase [Butyrivibrio sp.]|nr:HAMP domain-containing histidine kinase [Acetatifactor muris]MCM1558860.1 HAMP domain-containing histidine kinase [Butyrivibrio sp.]